MVLTYKRLHKWYFWFDSIFKRSKLNASYQKCRGDIYLLIDALMKNFETNYERRVWSTDHNSSLFLTQLYKLRDTMNLHQTRESILAFLFGGFDTTGNAIPSVLLLLAMHNDAQEKVFHELSSILSAENRGFTEQDLPQMKYLEMVIKESLRLIPVALGLARKVKKDLKLSKPLLWKLNYYSLFGVNLQEILCFQGIQLLEF